MKKYSHAPHVQQCKSDLYCSLPGYFLVLEYLSNSYIYTVIHCEVLPLPLSQFVPDLVTADYLNMFWALVMFLGFVTVVICHLLHLTHCLHLNCDFTLLWSVLHYLNPHSDSSPNITCRFSQRSCLLFKHPLIRKGGKTFEKIKWL